MISDSGQRGRPGVPKGRRVNLPFNSDSDGENPLQESGVISEGESKTSPAGPTRHGRRDQGRGSDVSRRNRDRIKQAQHGEIRPVDSTRTTRIDVRLIAATHRNLEAEVERGAFREDLTIVFVAWFSRFRRFEPAAMTFDCSLSMSGPGEPTVRARDRGRHTPGTRDHGEPAVARKRPRARGRAGAGDDLARRRLAEARGSRSRPSPTGATL